MSVNITLFQGSILDVPGVQAIVNPANSHLAHGGGVARIIANAARDYGKVIPPAAINNMHTGPQEDDIRYLAAEWDKEQAEHPLIATGDAGWTTAGALPYAGIIHAVGPVWGGGAFYERALLKRAHQNACARAHEQGCRSIAFPAISCGIFGFPVEKAAPVAVAAVADFWAREQPDGVGMQVTFALFEDAHMAAYTAAVANIVGM